MHSWSSKVIDFGSGSCRVSCCEGRCKATFVFKRLTIVNVTRFILKDESICIKMPTKLVLCIALLAPQSIDPLSRIISDNDKKKSLSIYTLTIDLFDLVFNLWRGILFIFDLDLKLFCNVYALVDNVSIASRELLT